MKINLGFWAVFSLLLFSCNKDKQQAVVPAYVQVSDITLKTNYATQGSSSEAINDAWLYIDGNFYAATELPCEFPVNKLGQHQVTIRPGIKVNGITNLRNYYRFYQPFDTTINFSSGQQINLNPELAYSSLTVFEFMEDFEKAGINFTYHANSDVNFTKTTQAFEGTYSGLIDLTSGLDYFEAQTPVLTNLPSDNSDVFLELNVKTNDLILVGIYAGTQKVAMYYINESDGNWNKIYFSLNEAVQKYSSYDIKLFFAIERDTNPDDDGRTSPDHIQAYIDNIKIVHF
jgi:hypothetical protein